MKNHIHNSNAVTSSESSTKNTFHSINPKVILQHRLSLIQVNRQFYMNSTSTTHTPTKQIRFCLLLKSSWEEQGPRTNPKPEPAAGASSRSQLIALSIHETPFRAPSICIIQSSTTARMCVNGQRQAFSQREG